MLILLLILITEEDGSVDTSFDFYLRDILLKCWSGHRLFLTATVVLPGPSNEVH
jgi:hypothetical protein